MPWNKFCLSSEDLISVRKVSPQQQLFSAIFLQHMEISGLFYWSKPIVSSTNLHPLHCPEKKSTISDKNLKNKYFDSQ